MMCPFQAISFLSLHASFPSSSCLVEKKTVITKCAITVNEYREKVVPSMRKIHAIVIFVSYSINHLYKNCEPEQLFSPGRKTKKPPPATCRKRLNLQYF
ncbi:hypothetical protein CKO_02115 [Citrobacter koseri ATCC BAA-895]|uniref:Uncharacterized protein n=1 Tax=Citrobacter koseri (strain ATCC BAA-895 / CDC 4225-83 / SGSC4696) TaxID=290338 RepID=A8AIC6_CITK8|nr:hypothetical protein CKO_02115 [Citrobacter koseri ATCC BAA-895]